MNWKEKVVVRILMLLAVLLAPDGWAKEVGNLANHLNSIRPDEK